MLAILFLISMLAIALIAMLVNHVWTKWILVGILLVFYG